MGLATRSSKNFALQLGLIKAILVLNLIDAVLTLIWVTGGYAYEANPLLRHWIETSPLVFVIGKLALVGLGSLILWRYRHRRLAVITVFLAFIVYYALLLWHLRLLGLLLNRYFVA